MSGLIGNILTGGLGTLLGPVVQRLADLIPDPAARAAAVADLQAKMLAADAAIEQQQATINAAEAANENIFVSGWRPFVGWVCGAGLAWQIFVGPMLGWIAALCGSHIPLPSFDTAATSAILVPLLGLGAYRTVEKVQGVAGDGVTQAQTRSTRVQVAQAQATATIASNAHLDAFGHPRQTLQ